jgi:hypothetical protein
LKYSPGDADEEVESVFAVAAVGMAGARPHGFSRVVCGASDDCVRQLRPGLVGRPLHFGV